MSRPSQRIAAAAAARPSISVRGHRVRLASTSSGSGPSSSGSSSSSASSSSQSSPSNKPRPTPAAPTSSSAAASYQRQRRAEWGLVAVAGSAAALGGWWYWHNVRPKHTLSKSNSSGSASPVTASNTSSSFSLSNRTAFHIASRSSSSSSSNGAGAYKIIHSLTSTEVDRVLREHERSTKVERPNGSCLVAQYDTNSVASNDPIEDKRAEVIVERDRPIWSSISDAAAQQAMVNAPNGDLCFFAVMDGHAGYATSTLLSQKLIAFVALELDKVFRQKGEYGQMARNNNSKSSTTAGVPSKVWNMIFGGTSSAAAPPKPASPLPSLGSRPHDASSAGGQGAGFSGGTAEPYVGLDGDPDIVRRAIIKAFKGLDKEICNTPIELLKEYEISLASSSSPSAGSGIASPAAPSRVVTASSSVGNNNPSGTRSLSSLAHSIFPSSSLLSGAPGFTQTQKTAYEAILPALSGSCALLTYIDSARGDLYVACTGDSRAIAGWWREKEGKWEIEALSTDQTGRSESEVKRMRAEHPAQESETVIMRGRVLGGLEPTRAFGDARYKWDRTIQDRLFDAFLPGGRASARQPPRYLQTPPYVTAEPVVEVRKIKIGPTQIAAPPTSSSASAAGTTAGTTTGAEVAAASSLATAPLPERELKFIVMATDGLWDMMSNEEVGSLVAGHLAGLKGDVLASTLKSRCFPVGNGPKELLPPPSSPKAADSAPVPPASVVASSAAAASAVDGEVNKKSNDGGHPLNRAPSHLKSFTFQDANISTHLIRNALGGAQRQRVAGLLAIPAPESRSYRDDITVNVILFHDAQSQAQAHQRQQQQAQQQQPQAAAAAEQPIKSKL